MKCKDNSAGAGTGNAIKRQAHAYSCWHSAQKKQDMCIDNITKQNVLDQNDPKSGVLPAISKDLKAQLDCAL